MTMIDSFNRPGLDKNEHPRDAPGTRRSSTDPR